MTVRVDIYVDDITGLLNQGYNEVKVYRSARRDSDYSEATVSGSRIALLSDIQRYTYTDVFGNADSWYKWSYLDTGLWAESSLSSPTRATISGSYFRGATYPAESYFTAGQQDTVHRIRQLVGDFKTTNRDYISSTTSYDNVSQDGYTVELDSPKGWPLSIEVDGTSYQGINEPIVRGYQFVTFSGTLINTVSGTVDIWYEGFRFSDREILESYENADTPSGLDATQTTTEMYEIQAAITILESEIRGFMATSSSAVAIYEEIKINPEAGMTSRLKDLDNLRKKLSDLTKAVVGNNLTLLGIRVD